MLHLLLLLTVLLDLLFLSIKLFLALRRMIRFILDVRGQTSGGREAKWLAT